MAYGLRIKDASGNVILSATDRITHYLYNWITTTTTAEIKTIPGMEYEKDIAVIICKRTVGMCATYGWEKLSDTQIKIKYSSAFELDPDDPPSANVYVLGF